MSNELNTEAWDKSYEKRDNFVFYPHKEVIRFIARNIRKRTGLESFQDQQTFDHTPRGLDLVSGDDSNHYPEFSGEETMTASFEKDTIQSYFNYGLIQDLVGDLFEVRECTLIRHSSVISNSWHCRYHVVLCH